MRKLQFGVGTFVGMTFVGMLVTVVAALGGGATAAGARPTPAVIHELTVFAGGHQPPVGTFTASGIPGCTSGSFSDQVVSFNHTGSRIVIDRTYACAGGNTLTARVGLHLGTIDAAGVQTADGSWRIISSTGALVGLDGSGSTSGLNSGCAPAGTALGECATGVGTVTASIQ
ncbi:MAG TPA: hypothetical protein VGM80_07675 [Gaiellaceae bacterium]|jgi:hypothetical protein